MAGEERGTPGGILALLSFCQEHRAALRWDFRHLLRISLDDIGGSVSYGEALDLVIELMKETGSHLVAELNGMTRPLSWADLSIIILAEAYLNSHRDPKKQPKPVQLFDLWQKQDPNADVTPERRRELQEQLERRSAFR